MPAARLLLSAAALCLACPAPGQAQDASASPPPEEEQICLTVAHRWAGSLDELKAIHAAPVPDSFRRTMESGGCSAWQLIRESLVSWHLAYGDEGTTRAALAYLEAQTLAGQPLRPRLSAESKGDVDVAQAYRFLAMEYARAADFYSSPALLAAARRFAEPSLAVGLALRAPRAPGSALQPFDDYPDRLWRDLDLQIAVVSARLGGTEAAFAAARAVFARNDDPHYNDAGQHAYQYGDDFCDIGDKTYLQAWHDACEANDFERRALAYWRYRAAFTLAAEAAGREGLGAPRDEWDGDTAIRLVQAAERAGHGLGGWYFGNAATISADIRLGMAEVELAKARRALSGGTATARGEAREACFAALDRFWDAATSINGSDHPGWTRRIGQRYLAASAFLETLRDPDDPVSAPHARRLAWFQTILPQLDAMARGDVAAPR